MINSNLFSVCPVRVIPVCCLGLGSFLKRDFWGEEGDVEKRESSDN